MNLVLAIIPVLLLIILMAFFKMSGDKSSVISLVVTMLIYGAQNEAYMSRSAEKWVRGLCFNELGVCG